MKRRAVRIIGAGLAVAAGLLVLAVALAVLFIDSDAVEDRVRSTWLPRFSEQLGREVSVGDIELALLPSPSVELDEVRVAGTAEHPLVETRRAAVELRWWPLLKSFGKDVVASRIVLDEPKLRVVRLPDGTWELTRLADRFGDSSSGRQYAIDELVVRGGELLLVDRAARSGTGRVALSKIDVTASNVGPGRRLELDGRASMDGRSHDVVTRLAIDPLPATFSNLPAAKWPRLEGELTLRDAPVQRLEAWLPPGLADTVSGGTLGMTANLATSDDDYVLSGDAEGEWLLRGEPSKVSFTVVASMPKGRPEALTAKVDPLRLSGPGVDATGQVEVDVRRQAASFALAGPLLDVDTLAGARPEGEEQQSAPPGALSEELRARLAKLDVRGRLSFDQVVARGVTVRDLEADARLQEGTLHVGNATGDFYGGRIDLSGTTLALDKPQPTWRLRAQLAETDLTRALDETGSVAAVRGELSGNLDLAGAGLSLDELKRTLDGTAALALADGQLAGRSLPAQVTDQLRARLSKLGLSAFASRVPKLEEGGTDLGDVKARLSVEEGWIRLESPVSWGTPFGEAQLGGRFGLDRRLEMTGTARLSPSFVATLTRGSFTPRAPVDLPFTVGGTLSSPQVTGVDTDALVRTLVRRQLAPQVEDVGKGLLERLPGF